MTSLRVALSFLTILPVGPKRLPERLAAARAWFPLVGLLLGAGLAALDAGLRRAFPLPVASALDLVALIGVTRGLHVDGFLDSCDALFGGHTRERRLEILRDPRVGSFAAVGGMCLLLSTWAALTALSSPSRPWVLILFPCLSRWGILLAMYLYPYARHQGLGAAFKQGSSPWHLAAGAAATVAGAVLLAGWAGVAMLALASVVALAAGRWMAGMLGGLTGDSYGAVNEVTAAAVLLLAVALAGHAGSLFRAPLPTGA